MAEDHAENNKVLFANLDLSQNEVPGLDIQSVPTLMVFKAGKAKAEPIEYIGKLRIHKVHKFLMKQFGEEFWIHDKISQDL